MCERSKWRNLMPPEGEKNNKGRHVTFGVSNCDRHVPLLHCHCQPLSTPPSLHLPNDMWVAVSISVYAHPPRVRRCTGSALRFAITGEAEVYFERQSVPTVGGKACGWKKEKKKRRTCSRRASSQNPSMYPCAWDARQGAQGERRRLVAEQARRLFWGFRRPWRMRAASPDSVRIAKPTRRGSGKTAGEVNGDDWGQVLSQPLPSCDTWFCSRARGLVEDVDWEAVITAETMYHLCY